MFLIDCTVPLHAEIGKILNFAFYGKNNNYYAKVIIIESQNKSFAAIIIEFISRGPKGREK